MVFVFFVLWGVFYVASLCALMAWISPHRDTGLPVPDHRAYWRVGVWVSGVSVLWVLFLVVFFEPRVGAW
jgi:hypothetical protein